METPRKWEKDGYVKKNNSVHFTRHSISEYKTYREIRASKEPGRALDPEDQVTPDLTEKGVELAERKAEEMLRDFDPRTDALFFVSSNEVRAIETANIYRKIAHTKGFEVLKPEHVRSGVAEKIGEGEIRTLKNLSLKRGNILINTIFNPEVRLESINWDAVDPEKKRRWEEARAIVMAHDYGSFGANFYRYSEKVKNILPEIASTHDLFKTQFRNLTRLAKFADRKMTKSGYKKNIKILAFGHENYMGQALREYTDDNAIKNCETIDVVVKDREVMLKRRVDVRASDATLS